MITSADPLSGLRLTPRWALVAEYPAGATFGPRRLRDFEFVWIERGSAVWEVAGRELPLTEGDVVLARPGQRDGFRWDPRRRTAHGFIHFEIRCGAESLPSAADWPLVRHDGEALILPLLRALYDRDPERESGFIEHALRLALVAFLAPRPVDPVAGERPEHPAVQRALDALYEAWRDGPTHPLTLGELASRAGVSDNHLIRLFREAFGHPPQTVQRYLRLERAATLLARSELPIQSIAADCGFACPFHFSKVFAKAYGQSPSVLRRRLRSGQTTRPSPLLRRRFGTDRR